MAREIKAPQEQEEEQLEALLDLGVSLQVKTTTPKMLKNVRFHTIIKRIKAGQSVARRAGTRDQRPTTNPYPHLTPHPITSSTSPRRLFSGFLGGKVFCQVVLSCRKFEQLL